MEVFDDREKNIKSILDGVKIKLNSLFDLSEKLKSGDEGLEKTILDQEGNLRDLDGKEITGIGGIKDKRFIVTGTQEIQEYPVYRDQPYAQQILEQYQELKKEIETDFSELSNLFGNDNQSQTYNLYQNELDRYILISSRTEDYDD